MALFELYCLFAYFFRLERLVKIGLEYMVYRLLTLHIYLFIHIFLARNVMTFNVRKYFFTNSIHNFGKNRSLTYVMIHKKSGVFKKMRLSHKEKKQFEAKKS